MHSLHAIVNFVVWHSAKAPYTHVTSLVDIGKYGKNIPEKCVLKQIETLRHMLSTVLSFPTGIIITPIWCRRPEGFPQGCCHHSSTHEKVSTVLNEYSYENL